MSPAAGMKGTRACVTHSMWPMTASRSRRPLLVSWLGTARECVTPRGRHGTSGTARHCTRRSPCRGLAVPARACVNSRERQCARTANGGAAMLEQVKRLAIARAEELARAYGCGRFPPFLVISSADGQLMMWEDDLPFE